jgi:hypothetical protein
MQHLVVFVLDLAIDELLSLNAVVGKASCNSGKTLALRVEVRTRAFRNDFSRVVTSMPLPLMKPSIVRFNAPQLLGWRTVAISVSRLVLGTIWFCALTQH